MRLTKPQKRELRQLWRDGVIIITETHQWRVLSNLEDKGLVEYNPESGSRGWYLSEEGETIAEQLNNR